MEVVEKTRRYTCRFMTPVISRRFTALFYTRYARTRALRSCWSRRQFPRARLTKGDDIDEGMKKEEKKEERNRSRSRARDVNRVLIDLENVRVCINKTAR